MKPLTAKARESIACLLLVLLSGCGRGSGEKAAVRPAAINEAPPALRQFQSEQAKGMEADAKRMAAVRAAQEKR